MSFKLEIDDDLSRFDGFDKDFVTSACAHGSVGRAFCIPIIKPSITLIGLFLYTQKNP